MIYLHVDDSTLDKGVNFNAETIRLAAQSTLTLTGTSPEVSFSIVISNDEQLQQLNRQFRHIDAPTDVLSFPADDVNPENIERYIGDIVISIERAQAQVEKPLFEAEGTSDYKVNTLQDELLLLAVHGVLHLLGYDHGNEEEKERMWKMQTTILNKVGETQG